MYDVMIGSSLRPLAGLWNDELLDVEIQSFEGHFMSFHVISSLAEEK